MLSYTRKTESLNGGEPSYYQVDLPVVEEYKKVTGDVKLPDYFVTSQNLNWKDRIRMQAALQEYCDTAISSTVNLSEDATIEDVRNLYIEAWKQGLKGVTIFRNNCKRIGILTEEPKKEDQIQLEADHSSFIFDEDSFALKRGEIIKADDDCIGLKRTLITGCGTLHCESFWDPDTGELREMYLSKGSKGGCNNFMIGLSRMVSLSARGGISIDNIIDQLNSCGVCPSYAVRHAVKKDTSLGSCCPVAIGNALKDMYEEIQERIHYCHDTMSKVDVQYRLEESLKSMEQYEECPSCHKKGLTHIGGCDQCILCGYSKCN
jgi:ribonucleoside-diphosphate reductase alpha chain